MLILVRLGMISIRCIFSQINFSNLAFQTAHGRQMRQPPPKKYTPTPLPSPPPPPHSWKWKSPPKFQNFQIPFSLTLGDGWEGVLTVHSIINFIICKKNFAFLFIVHNFLITYELYFKKFSFIYIATLVYFCILMMS